METDILENEQIPINDNLLFKLNFVFLSKTNKCKTLKDIIKKIGESIFSSNGKRLTKKKLIEKILNNSKYEFLSELDIKQKEYEMKLEYYKTIPNRLYKNTIKKINKNYDKPCLLYNSKNKNKYGIIEVYKKMEFKHRVSYALYNNIFVEDILKYNDKGEELQICHGKDCDKHCIEPTHLELKTCLINMYNDKIRDGTLKIGENNHRSKITEKQALEIINSKREGTQKERANKLKVSINIIKSIDRGNTWMHLSGIDNSEKRMINRKRKKENKKREFTKEEYEKTLEKIKNNCDFVILDENIETPCWLFNGALYKDGYGQTQFKGMKYRTHILAYEAVYGKRDLTGENKIIRHLCNNKSCCNPEHLKFGTYSENIIDAYKNGHKGRKLSDEDIREIRNLIKDEKLTIKEISNKFKMGTTAIYNIKNNKTYQYVI